LNIDISIWNKLEMKKLSETFIFFVY